MRFRKTQLILIASLYAMPANFSLSGELPNITMRHFGVLLPVRRWPFIR